MTCRKWIDAVVLSCVIALASAPALAQQAAKGGTLLTSAPGTLLEQASYTLTPATVKASSGKTGDETAGGDVQISESCPPDSDHCDAVEPARTGLLTGNQPQRPLPFTYRPRWFSGPSYGGSGGMGISITFGSGAGSGGAGLISSPPGIISSPIPPLLPNICLP